jgi:hypothetical protein
MRPNDFDIRLYDTGAHTLINSVVAPLVALTDADALATLVGYVRMYLSQPASLGIMTNCEAIQHFILHAQRAGILDATFFDASFESQVKQQVPQSPPIAPPTVYLSDAGGGVVNASCILGNYADRYELQLLDGAVWSTVAQGVIGESVSFQATGVAVGTRSFRVLPRIGFFAGFPTPSAQVVVV